jgi:lysozyme
MSDPLSDMIKRHEGRSLTTYRDTVGVLTVGCGHALPDNGRALYAIGRQIDEGDRITDYECDELLQHDIAIAKAALVMKYPAYSKLDPVRQAVLIDMAFNLGWPRLSAFKNTLAFIEARMYQDAALEMLQSKWATQVGKRAHELALMMGSGQWQ